MEVLTNASVVVILQHINVSNQCILSLKLMQYYKSVISQLKNRYSAMRVKLSSSLSILHRSAIMILSKYRAGHVTHLSQTTDFPLI